MAETLFSGAADGRHEARSAGTRPAERVHREVVKAMAELGVDLSGRAPRALAREDAEWADVVVTMGCGDQCPYIPGKVYLDWSLPDPGGKTSDEVGAIRDEISKRVTELARSLDDISL